jgi:hypothetical protein
VICCSLQDASGGILLLERHISCAYTVVIGKSCRHTTEVVTLDRMPRCAAKCHEGSSGSQPPGIVRVASPASRARSPVRQPAADGHRKCSAASPLPVFSFSKAMAPAGCTAAISGPLDVAANSAGLGSRRRAVRACARSATHRAPGPRSAARAAEPWSRRRAETSDLRVAARLGGRRDIKDIQDAGREAAASRMQREAGRRPRSSVAIVVAFSGQKQTIRSIRSFFCG